MAVEVSPLLVYRLRSLYQPVRLLIETRLVLSVGHLAVYCVLFSPCLPFCLVSSFIPSRGSAVFPFNVSAQHTVQGLPRFMRPPPPTWALRFTTPDEPFLESTRRHPPTLLRWYSYLPCYIGSHPVWFLYVFFFLAISSPQNPIVMLPDKDVRI